MAVKHYCDICGVEMEPQFKQNVWHSGTENLFDDGDFDLELCPGCYRDLRYFIRMRKEGKCVGYFNEEDSYDR